MISSLWHKSKYKSNSISNFFEKKNQIFWFPCCSTREELSIDVSITNVGLILTKLRFLFPGYGQTDTISESSYGNKSVHKKISTQSSKLREPTQNFRNCKKKSVEKASSGMGEMRPKILGGYVNLLEPP